MEAYVVERMRYRYQQLSIENYAEKVRGDEGYGSYTK